MKWNDEEAADELFLLGKSFFENEAEPFLQICPVCGTHEVHFYAHWWKENDATIWVWCSNCRRSTHGLIRNCPCWYINYVRIDVKRLCAHPDYLEEHKSKVY